MIVGSRVPLEVGSIITIGWTDKDLNHREPHPFYIIREVTFKEYEKYCIEMGVDPLLIFASSTDHFYEVSTD